MDLKVWDIVIPDVHEELILQIQQHELELLYSMRQLLKLILRFIFLEKKDITKTLVKFYKQLETNTIAIQLT
jgi:hypothetical protein